MNKELRINYLFQSLKRKKREVREGEVMVTHV